MAKPGLRQWYEVEFSCYSLVYMGMKIIKDKQIIDDGWRLIRGANAGDFADVSDDGDLIVPLSFWQARTTQLQQRKGRVGVWLDSHEDPALLSAVAANLPLIAVNFPQFTDGRGYSIGRLLRERYGFKGELRAIGDVLRDQIFYMARCGFNAFAVRADKNIDDALHAFDDFSEGYQTAVDRPLPLFRRRLS